MNIMLKFVNYVEGHNYLRSICTALLLIILVFCGACSSTSTTSPKATVHFTASDQHILSGQHIWKQGVSSYLFGANDTVEWSSDSVLTDPKHVIVAALAHAHVGLIRSFFFHYTFYGGKDDHRTTIGQNPASTKDFRLEQYKSPAPQGDQLPGNFYEIEKRISMIEKVGAHCLGVLPSITTDPSQPGDGIAKHNYIDPITGKPETDLQFDEKIVEYLGNRCNLYEFGNEPDYNGVSESTYVQKWDEFVPLLKAINPNAKFIGPVTASNQGMNGTYMTDFLKDIKAGKVKPVPDAISFHQYPCANVDASNENQCFDANNQSSVFNYSTSISQVRDWMQKMLGHILPLGITEWNADPGSNPYLENAAFMTKFTHDSIQTMIDAKLDFAVQFDIQSYSGYCHLDMFNSCSGTDQPKAQFTEMAKMISQYYNESTP